MSEHSDRIAAILRISLEEGDTLKQAAFNAGISYGSAARHARQAGIKFPHGSLVANDCRSPAMAESYRNGETLLQIGKRYGVTRERVRQILKKHHNISRMDGGAYLRMLQRTAIEPRIDRAALINGYIYFAKPIDFDGPLKIGFSELPAGRLASLAAWSPFPLEIVVAIPGNLRLEANIHDCLAPYHSHHEWFFPEPPVMQLVERLEAGTPIQDAIDLSRRLGTVRRKRGPARKIEQATAGAVSASDFKRIPSSPASTEAAA